MSNGMHEPAGAARRGDGVDAMRRAKARRNAWLLAAVAVLFYFGYMAWTFVRSGGG